MWESDPVTRWSRGSGSRVAEQLVQQAQCIGTEQRDKKGTWDWEGTRVKLQYRHCSTMQVNSILATVTPTELQRRRLGFLRFWYYVSKDSICVLNNWIFFCSILKLHIYIRGLQEIRNIIMQKIRKAIDTKSYKYNNAENQESDRYKIL
jgi:hypothetical protein